MAKVSLNFLPHKKVSIAKQGDIFYDPDNPAENTYILSYLPQGMIQQAVLINLQKGTHRCEIKEIRNINCITESELLSLFGGKALVKLEKDESIIVSG